MNKKILPIIIVIVLLLMAGGWYFMSSRKTVTTGPTSNSDSKNENQSATVANLKDLLSKGIAQTCTFASGDSKGTVFMAGGKVRQDFEVTSEGQTLKYHVIIADNTIYNWSDESKAGIKMAFDPNATPPPVTGSPAPDPGGTLNANTNMDYKCTPWLADSAKFSLPTGITFVPFDTPSQGTPSQNSSSSQCAYCDSLSGSDKTQCLAALKCN